MHFEKLSKSRLNRLYLYFNKQPLFDDPIIFPHRFSNPIDIEFAAFISSLFAYGNIKQILKTLDNIFSFFGDNPTNNLISADRRTIQKFFNFKYRFYSAQDITNLILSLQYIYKNYSSIKTFINIERFDSAKDLIETISNKFLQLFKNLTTENSSDIGAKFMFPLPSRGGTCKRMNLFLRWMVREDNIDFGLWKEFGTQNLVIPVDTHICKIAQKFRLTNLKSPSWNMAQQITDNLKKFDKDDPVKYDFALCHLGIRKKINY